MLTMMSMWIIMSILMVALFNSGVYMDGVVYCKDGVCMDDDINVDTRLM